MELTQQHVFGGLFAVIILLISWILVRQTRNEKSKINFDDLLLDETGKLGKEAAVLFGSFIVTSVVLVYQTFKGTLTDLTFAAYMTAWVAPAVSKIFKTVPPSQTTDGAEK